jgi:2-methylcitrate dehydratase
MLYLVNLHDLKPENVTGIRCDLQPGKPTYRYLQPKTDLEAKYSLGYGIAMCLIDRNLGIEQYSPERIMDPKTLDVLSRIIHVPQTVDSEKHRVTIQLIDGSEYSHSVPHSKGVAGRDPLSDEEVREKYRYCARRALPDSKIERSLELIGSMEQVSDMKEVMDAVVDPQGDRRTREGI